MSKILKSRSDQKIIQEEVLDGDSTGKIPHREHRTINISMMLEKARNANISVQKNEKRIAVKEEIERQIRSIRKIAISHGWDKIKKMSFTYKKLSIQEAKLLALLIGRNLTKLEKLRVDILTWDITDAEVEFLGTEIARNLPQLQVLSLSFQGGEITDRSIETLGREIGRNLSQLQNLDLSFVECNVSEKGLSAFGTEIGRHLSKLQKLKLLWSQCYMRDYEVDEILGSGFGRNLDNLQQLDLSICWTEITSIGLRILASEIARLSQLKSLLLNFSCSSEISDAGLNSLGLILGEKLTQLQQLGLQFEACDLVSDRGVESIVLRMGKNLTKLQRLSLEFQTCERVSNDALKVVASEIGRHSGLRQLYLDFSNCQITDEGVLQFMPAIKKLTQLQILTLELIPAEYEAISNESVGAIRKEIEKLTQIQEFKLNFGSAGRYTSKP